MSRRITTSLSISGLAFAAFGFPAWASDPYLVKDINPAGSSGPDMLEAAAGQLFFRATDGMNGVEPWRSDGTVAGTSMVLDIYAGAQGSYPSAFTGSNGDCLFAANNGSIGYELWRTNATGTQTVLVRDINPGAADSWPGISVPFTRAGDNLYFRAYTNAAGYELWRTDGTTSGTALVEDINPGPSAATPLELTNASGIVYFRADDGVPAGNHRELWKSDGTANGTVLVADINPGGEGYPSNLTEFHGVLLFQANDGVHGDELWRSNGTAGGTFMIADIHPTGSSFPGQLHSWNGFIYFMANDGTNGAELWRTDATTAGTSMVVDLNPAGSSPIITIFPMENALFFVQLVSSQRASLWRTDGTAEGTMMLKEFVPNDRHPILAELSDLDGTLYFSANDGVHGAELWKSDGTIEGTVLAGDIRPGDAWSNSYPQNLTIVNGKLFFAADDGVNGRELWAVDADAPSGVPLDAPVFTLMASFPNPTRTTASLQFALATAAPVSLRVYDVAGRPVRVLLAARRFDAGMQTVRWDGRDDRGREVASGVYVYRLSAGRTSRGGQIVLSR